MIWTLTLKHIPQEGFFTFYNKENWNFEKHYCQNTLETMETSSHMACYMSYRIVAR